MQSDIQQILNAMRSSQPHFELENRLAEEKPLPVAGIDEAGRGPLAGPVVAAAVILDPGAIPDGLNDSKKLSEANRAALFAGVLESALSVAWASTPAAEIDRINIHRASLQAMARAVAGLSLRPGAALFDGRHVPAEIMNEGAIKGIAVVKGDTISLSVAAASIIAKVIRDHQLVQACRQYPDYGFSRHKGYATRQHREAINRLGPCSLHRKSFSPIKDMRQT